MKTIVALLCVSLRLLAGDVTHAQAAIDGTASTPSFTSEDTAVIRLRSGQLPEVRVSGALLHRLLAAEFAAQQGDIDAAARAMLGLSRTIGDVRLVRRALEFFWAADNLPGALEAARDWRRLTPDDEEARSAELTLAVAAGQTEGIVAALRARMAAAGEVPANQAAAIREVRATLAHLRDRAQALAILDAVLPSDARQLPAARLALARLAHAAGDVARALTEARLALALQPDAEDAARLLLEYGLQASAPADSAESADVDIADAAITEAAIAEARRFAARYPNARRLRLTLVQALSDAGRHDEAIDELQAMARHAPEDFDLLTMQAQVQLGAGRLAAARALLHQYIAVQSQRRDANRPEATDATSNLAEAWLLLARIAEREDRLDDAVALLDHVDDESVLYAVRLRQALLLARLHRVDEALATVYALDAQDEDEAIRAALVAAQILHNADRIDEAIEELVAADADFPDTVPVKYDLAMLYERENNLAEFERLMRAIITLEPDHAQAHNALGYTLAERNIRLLEAQDLIVRAHELRPDDPYILDSLGWVYYRLGQFDHALAYLQRAWDAQPQVEIAAHLGEVLWRTGQRDAARERWRDGAALDAGSQTLRETLQRFGVDLGAPQ